MEYHAAVARRILLPSIYSSGKNTKIYLVKKQSPEQCRHCGQVSWPLSLLGPGTRQVSEQPSDDASPQLSSRSQPWVFTAEVPDIMGQRPAIPEFLTHRINEHN